MEIINGIGSTYTVFANVLHQGNEAWQNGVIFWQEFLAYSKSCLWCWITNISNKY